MEDNKKSDSFSASSSGCIKGKGFTGCLLCGNEDGKHYFQSQMAIKGVKFCCETNKYDAMLSTTRLCLECIGRIHQSVKFLKNAYTFFKYDCDETKEKCDFCITESKDELIESNFDDAVREVVDASILRVKFGQINKVQCCYSCYKSIKSLNALTSEIEMAYEEFLRLLNNWTIKLDRCKIIDTEIIDDVKDSNTSVKNEKQTNEVLLNDDNPTKLHIKKPRRIRKKVKLQKKIQSAGDPNEFKLKKTSENIVKTSKDIVEKKRRGRKPKMTTIVKNVQEKQRSLRNSIIKIEKNQEEEKQIELDDQSKTLEQNETLTLNNTNISESMNSLNMDMSLSIKSDKKKEENKITESPKSKENESETSKIMEIRDCSVFLQRLVISLEEMNDCFVKDIPQYEVNTNFAQEMDTNTSVSQNSNLEVPNQKALFEKFPTNEITDCATDASPKVIKIPLPEKTKSLEDFTMETETTKIELDIPADHKLPKQQNDTLPTELVSQVDPLESLVVSNISNIKKNGILKDEERNNNSSHKANVLNGKRGRKSGQKRGKSSNKKYVSSKKMKLNNHISTEISTNNNSKIIEEKTEEAQIVSKNGPNENGHLEMSDSALPELKNEELINNISYKANALNKKRGRKSREKRGRKSREKRAKSLNKKKYVSPKKMKLNDQISTEISTNNNSKIIDEKIEEAQIVSKNDSKENDHLEISDSALPEDIEITEEYLEYNSTGAEDIGNEAICTTEIEFLDINKVVRFQKARSKTKVTNEDNTIVDSLGADSTYTNHVFDDFDNFAAFEEIVYTHSASTTRHTVSSMTLEEFLQEDALISSN